MKKRKTSLFNKLIIPIAIGLLIALVLGILAGICNPNEYVFLAFFGLAYPYLLLANAILLIIWLMQRKWFFSLLTVVVICSGWHTLISTVGLFGDEGSDQKESPDLLRMMTYNVHAFKPYGDVITEEVKEQMLQVVKDQNPDVICFQEFYTKPKGPYDTVDSLKKLLNTKYYYFKPTIKNEVEAMGLAIFSKYPIKYGESIEFGSDSGNESVFVDVDVHGQLLRVYNVHLQSISFEKEDYAALEQVKKMKVEKTSSKRILRMLKTAFIKRGNQVGIMKAHFSTCKTPYIIAGDFNDTPASYAVTQITDSLNNAFIKKGSGLSRTYNGKFPNFQIDYIASTKGLDIVNYRVIEAKLSDHFPVRSDLRFKVNKQN